jgi:hypothetical protein
MSVIIETLPSSTASQSVTLVEVIGSLPDVLPFPRTIWIGGRLMKCGKEFKDNAIVFYVETNFEIEPAIKQFFNTAMQTLGCEATASNQWRSQKGRFPIYTKGVLMVDRTSGMINHLPEATDLDEELTVEELCAAIPQSLPWKIDVWLTGSLAKEGKTWNDADFIIFEENDWKAHAKDFKALLEEVTNGWRCDVGKAVMPDREPVYLFKLYDKGVCTCPRP